MARPAIQRRGIICSLLGQFAGLTTNVRIPCPRRGPGIAAKSWDRYRRQNANRTDRSINRHHLCACVRISGGHRRPRARRHHRVSRLAYARAAHTRGFSGGVSLIIVAFEFRCEHHRDDVNCCRVSRHARQRAVADAPRHLGTQFYGTIGAQGYQESLSAFEETYSAPTSAAARDQIGGSLRVRLDIASSSCRVSPAGIYQRFVSANLKF